VIAQQTVERRGWKDHDFVRTLRMSTFGGVFAGPILSTWYRFIDKKITTPVPSKGK
jgi:protein Mpv17